MNLLIVTARLGSTAEIRYTTGGKAICTFSAAFDSGFGDHKVTTWVRCNLWGKRAEGNLPTYLVKGAQVAISGELSNREYEKNGEKRYSLEVNVDQLTLIGGKQTQAPAPQQAASQTSMEQTAQGMAEKFEEFDDGIPF